MQEPLVGQLTGRGMQRMKRRRSAAPRWALDMVVEEQIQSRLKGDVCAWSNQLNVVEIWDENVELSRKTEAIL